MLGVARTFQSSFSRSYSGVPIQWYSHQLWIVPDCLLSTGSEFGVYTVNTTLVPLVLLLFLSSHFVPLSILWSSMLFTCNLLLQEVTCPAQANLCKYSCVIWTSIICLLKSSKRHTKYPFCWGQHNSLFTSSWNIAKIFCLLSRGPVLCTLSAHSCVGRELTKQERGNLSTRLDWRC